VLHEIGEGTLCVQYFERRAVHAGSICVGGAKNVLTISSKYAKERKAFGKQIGKFGMLREKLAEMAIQIFAVESMVYRSQEISSGDDALQFPVGDKIRVR